jgi:hypothetical protein
MSITIGIVILLLLFLIKWLFSEWSEHRWNYHNPYNRTCRICGRNEQEECWGDDLEELGMSAPGEWVVYHHGNPEKHKK